MLLKLSDGVLVSLITSVAAIVTSAITGLVSVVSRRNTKRDVSDVHEAVSSIRREVRTGAPELGELADMPRPRPKRRV